MDMKKLILNAFIVPLTLNNNWKILEYNKIKANIVAFQSQELEIKVNQSASPIFYVFDSPKTIQNFSVKVAFQSLPKFQNVLNQGEDKNDDYALRIGFIEKGSKKLNYLQRIFAPEWIKQLYDQFGNQYGIEKVHFYNFTQNKLQIGKIRNHPKSNDIDETFVYYLEGPSEVNFVYRLPKSIEALGIWISSDGDDSKSIYNLKIKEIKLNYNLKGFE
jgi:hypothetical protein